MATPRKSSSKPKEEEKQPIAYFLELEVEDVLCFKDRQHLNLSDKQGNPAQWTVILGDNGVGKTTLLRCLASMGMHVEDDKYEDGVSDTSPIFQNYYAYPSLLEWRSEEELLWDDWRIGVDVLCGFKIQNLNSYINKIRNKDILWLQVNGQSSYDGFDSKDLPGLICYGYGAIRRIGSTTPDKRFYQESCASLFSDKAQLINAEEWLLQIDYSSKYSTGDKKKNLLNKINDIKKIFVQTLPDIEDFRITLDEDPSERPRLKFSTPYGWVHFSDLGLGYKTMIVWMLDLIIRLYERYPDSEDPLAEPAIVLVDEIDLHLHPKWQRQIMSFLTERFPNTQFIVTAHSPLVVQASQDANIVLLRREGDRVVIDNDPEIIDNWRVDQILTSLFELPSARPAKLDPYIEEREAILAKPHLTDSDQQRLEELREAIGSFPSGERPEERQAMDIIRRAAKLIEEQNKHDSDS